MNYIKEINSFYDWIVVHEVNGQRIALWHTIMHVAYQAGKTEGIPISNYLLQSKSGLSKSALSRAREWLIMNGRIKIDVRPGKLATMYTIILFNK